LPSLVAVRIPGLQIANVIVEVLIRVFVRECVYRRILLLEKVLVSQNSKPTVAGLLYVNLPHSVAEVSVVIPTLRVSTQ